MSRVSPTDAMTDDLWARLAAFVPDALDLPDAERDAFLDRACRTPTGEPDAALRAEADRMVANALAADTDGVLVSPMGGFASDVADGAGLTAHAPPETVGPWRVTGVLGEGGQGVVYRAVRADGAFEREVALKLLRPGAALGEGGARLAARLAEERRVLGRLEHEGIARLYDGGLDGDGRPYLALELVDGEPITDASARLGLRERVALLADACDAVAYAHARLVVHRDLKPSNVLVTDGGPERGRPKLLDFGVAKLLSDEADPTVTVPGWMTPAYAAPEQVAGGEVTTATDVYALGVLAYEILTGRRPYETAGLSPTEAERVVTEADPPVPSASAPDDVARALRGDLDTVVMKALAKEPKRRYETAAALADDLRRWLDRLPIEARPATAAYRASRFVRRHRAAVAGAALALAAVVGVTGAAFARVAAERDRAETEAARAEATNEFLTGLLAAPEASWFAASTASGPDVTVAEVITAAAAQLDREPPADATVEASIHRALGIAYRGLTRYDDAAARLRRAEALLRERAPSSEAELGLVLHDLAQVRYYQNDPAGADSLLRLSLALWERVNDSPDAERVQLANDLALAQIALGRLPDAEPYLREAVTLGRTTPDVPTGGRASTLANLAGLLLRLGQPSEAEAIAEEAVAVQQEARITGTNVWVESLAALADIRAAQRRFAEADSLYARAQVTATDVYPSGSPFVASLALRRARTLSQLGRPAQAVRSADQALATLEALFPPGSEPVASALLVRGQAYAALDRGAEAETDLRRSVSGFDAAFSNPAPPRALARQALARVLMDRSQPSRAVPVLREALELAEQAEAAGLPVPPDLEAQLRATLRTALD